MAVKKSSSASKKAGFVGYKGLIKAGKNKLRKIERHLKKHPGDNQAQAAKGDARNHPGRTAPKRMGARLNAFVGERDQMALAEQLIDLKQATRESCVVKNRSLNLLSGRISALGLRVQQAARQDRAVRNQAQFDRKGTVFPKPRMTKAERDLAKARALGKQEASGVSKAKQKRMAAAAKPKAVAKA